MNKVFSVLLGLALLGLLTALVGCSRETWRVPLVMPADTLPLLPSTLQAKKITITGPVTFTTQLGTGNTSTAAATDNTKAGQRQGSAAIGAGSTASTKPGGTAWWVFGALLAVGGGCGFWLRGRL
jgi:hypothetical protein